MAAPRCCCRVKSSQLHAQAAMLLLLLLLLLLDSSRDLAASVPLLGALPGGHPADRVMEVDLRMAHLSTGQDRAWGSWQGYWQDHARVHARTFSHCHRLLIESCVPDHTRATARLVLPAGSPLCMRSSRQGLEWALAGAARGAAMQSRWAAQRPERRLPAAGQGPRGQASPAARHRHPAPIR